MKPCRKCGSTDRYPSGGCKKCSNEQQRIKRVVNAEAIKANRDRWRKENAEKLRMQHRAWLLNTNGQVTKPREQKLTKPRKGRVPLKDKPCRHHGMVGRMPSGGCLKCNVIAKQKYRDENAAKVKAARDALRARHADKLNVQNQARRKLAKLRGTLSEDIVEKLFASQQGLCNCCDKSLADGYDLDHIMPLSRGGMNEDWNMQLLTTSCNRSKGAKNPIEFLLSRAKSF